MRRIFVILMVVTALLLVGCGDGRASHGAKSLDKAKANFYRIQASYELIETGEQINFDYEVSAYNRDVVGSYSGVLFPHVMFQKTPSGQAIAIDPPRYYHLNGLEWFNGVDWRRKQQMAAMTWYPDANDLTYGESYLSSDTYLGPRAKVRILDYSVTQSNRKAYNKWLKSKIEENHDGANHPWSLGCITESSGPDAEACTYTKTRYSQRVSPNDNGEGEAVYDKHRPFLVHGQFAVPKPLYAAKVTVWPKEVFARYMKAYEGRRSYNKRFYCYYQEIQDPLIDPINHPKNLSENQKLRQKELKSINNDMRSADIAQTGRGKVLDWGRYLSLPVAQGKSKLMTRSTGVDGSTGQFPIAPIYPAVDHSVLTIDPETQEPDYNYITQILMTDEWRGVGLPSRLPITELTDEIPVIKPTGKYKSEIYINDELICGSPHYKKNFTIYDLKLGRQINVERA